MFVILNHGELKPDILVLAGAFYSSMVFNVDNRGATAFLFYDNGVSLIWKGINAIYLLHNFGEL